MWWYWPPFLLRVIKQTHQLIHIFIKKQNGCLEGIIKEREATANFMRNLIPLTRPRQTFIEINLSFKDLNQLVVLKDMIKVECHRAEYHQINEYDFSDELTKQPSIYSTVFGAKYCEKRRFVLKISVCMFISHKGRSLDNHFPKWYVISSDNMHKGAWYMWSWSILSLTDSAVNTQGLEY